KCARLAAVERPGRLSMVVRRRRTGHPSLCCPSGHPRGVAGGANHEPRIKKGRVHFRGPDHLSFLPAGSRRLHGSHDRLLQACCAFVYTTVSVTSTLPRVALEYGQTTCALSTSACAWS